MRAPNNNSAYSHDIRLFSLAAAHVQRAIMIERRHFVVDRCCAVSHLYYWQIVILVSERGTYTVVFCLDLLSSDALYVVVFASCSSDDYTFHLSRAATSHFRCTLYEFGAFIAPCCDVVWRHTYS